MRSEDTLMHSWNLTVTKKRYKIPCRFPKPHLPPVNQKRPYRTWNFYASRADTYKKDGGCFSFYSKSAYYVRRSLSVVAPLFVILILPELWKNRNANSTEIECTTFYSLRLIYATRMTLFAITDLLLITLFTISTAFTAQITLWEMMIHFFLPFNMSCCICFTSFYKSKYVSETCSILLCAVWTSLWILVILNDAVYNTISAPLWFFMILLSFLGAGWSISRGQTKPLEFHLINNGGKTIWN